MFRFPGLCSYPSPPYLKTDYFTLTDGKYVLFSGGGGSPPKSIAVSEKLISLDLFLVFEKDKMKENEGEEEAESTERRTRKKERASANGSAMAR